MSQPNGMPTTKYALHILECAAIAKQVGEALGLREDAARQACFATVCIDAKGHGVFLEPVPPHSKAQVKEPVPAASGNGTERHAAAAAEVAAIFDEAAARKADDQVKDVIRNPTPEQSDGANRTALLDAINKGCNLLNKAGYTPIITPKALNEIINSELKFEGNLGTLDVEQLELVAKLLITRLDTFKANKKALEAEAPF